jgi:hypothetical protein
MSDVASDSVAVYIGVPLANPLYSPASDPVSESDCVTVGSFTYCNSPPPTTAASPSQGVTVTSVVNDIVYAISVVFDDIAQAIAELAPYLISFIAAFSVVVHTYNAVRGVVMRFFGRYFRI